MGANNSGKTSVAHAMHFFISGARDRVSFHDISACRWSDVDSFEAGQADAALPVLSLDLWFGVEQAYLPRVIDLLPNLEWRGVMAGLRIDFAPRNEGYLRESPWVSIDVVLSLRYDLAPQERGLTRAPSSSIWTFPDDYLERAGAALDRAESASP